MASHKLTLTLQQLDANGEVLARRVSAFEDESPTTGSFETGILTSTGETTVTFPTNVTQLRQVVVKNTHASGTLSVKWTPTTGSEVVAAVLGPGDVIALFSQTTGATKGVSTLKLTASIANLTYELFIGS